jgi:hypothetical protein
MYSAIFIHEHEKREEVAKRWPKNIGAKKMQDIYKIYSIHKMHGNIKLYIHWVQYIEKKYNIKNI